MYNETYIKLCLYIYNMELNKPASSPIQLPKHRSIIHYKILQKKIDLQAKMIHYDKKIINLQSNKIKKLENTIQILENTDNQTIVSVLKHSGAFDCDLIEEINRKEEVIHHKNTKISTLISIIREKNIELTRLNKLT